MKLKKKINYTKVSKTKKKIAIKRLRIKIEKKTKLKDNYKFFIEY
jgi:ribosomal protein L14E/L6E/L27E